MSHYTPSVESGSGEDGSVIPQEGVKVLVSESQVDSGQSRTSALKAFEP